MRSRSLFALLMVAMAVPALAQRAGDTRPGIAVFPFTNGGSYGQDKENFDALEVGIAGMLISELSANPAARQGTTVSANFSAGARTVSSFSSD